MFGLTAAHGSADIAWAVVEGVSLGLRDGLDTLQRPADGLALVGGGARSSWWAQLLADILELPLNGSKASAPVPWAPHAWRGSPMAAMWPQSAPLPTVAGISIPIPRKRRRTVPATTAFAPFTAPCGCRSGTEPSKKWL